jgi:F0F1-type ATP synthase epsilon subunit
VLADSATAVEDIDAAVFAGEIKDTEEDIADATDEAVRDKARRRLEQLRAVQAAVSGAGAGAH